MGWIQSTKKNQIRESVHSAIGRSWCLIASLMASSTLLISLEMAEAATPPPQSFTYQGRLFQTNGTTPLTDTVNFTIEILDPSGTCLLYKERISNYNLSPTNGLFSINVGTALSETTKRISPDPGLTMAEVFSNTFDHTTLGGSCTGFIASTLAPTAKRKMRVTISNVTTGAADVVLSPTQNVNTTPYATVAESLQGYGPDKFIKVVGTTTQAAIDSLALKSTELGLLAAQSTKLLALTNGATAGGVLNIGTPTSGTDPVNKSYADGKLGGLTFDVSTIAPTTTGQSIRYNQAANKWEVYTPASSAISGSTLASTGNATIGGNAAITGSATIGTTLAVTGASTFTGAATFNGNVTIGAQKWLSLGAYTTVQETALTGAFTAADAGKVWYNSTTNKMMYFDGTSAVAIGSGGGGGSGTVTAVSIAAASSTYLTVATPSTTPTITLNVGTTAGTVAAGNDTRIANALQKDGSVSMTGDLNLGGSRKIVNALDPSSAQDVATKNYADGKVAGVTTSLTSLANGDVLYKTASGWVNQSLTTLVQATTITTGQLSGTVAKANGGTGVDNTDVVQKQFFAGPVSGANAAAAFRTIASTDLPIGTTSGTVAAGDDSRLVNALQKDGSVAMTGDLNLNGRKIIGGAAPTGDADFATKAYVDAAGGGSGYTTTCTAQTSSANILCVRTNGATGVTDCSYTSNTGSTWNPCGNSAFAGSSADIKQGFFVMTYSTYTGNLGGLAGADALCLTELTNYPWMGKADAENRGMLTSTKVKAFLCDNSTCQNGQPFTKYAHSIVGDVLNGGRTFTSDVNGLGPNDSNNWSVSASFAGGWNFWSGRHPGSSTTKFPNTPYSSQNCNNWTHSGGSYFAATGYTANSDQYRWSMNSSVGCGNNYPLICWVHP